MEFVLKREEARAVLYGAPAAAEADGITYLIVRLGAGKRNPEGPPRIEVPVDALIELRDTGHCSWSPWDSDQRYVIRTRSGRPIL